VILPDGTNVNHTLVKDGWCWWYRKYAPRDTVLEGLENEAREGRKGLWADPQPVPPWEWSQDFACPVEKDFQGLQKILGFEQPARSS